MHTDNTKPVPYDSTLNTAYLFKLSQRSQCKCINNHSQGMSIEAVCIRYRYLAHRTTLIKFDQNVKMKNEIIINSYFLDNRQYSTGCTRIRLFF